MNDLKNTLKKITVFKLTVIYARIVRNQYSLIKKSVLFFDFLRDYRAYRHMKHNDRFILATADLYPRVYDKTSTTPVDPVYFYQDAWCAQKVFMQKPARHIDVGSHLPTIGIISQFVPTAMVDIRPLTVTLPGLSFIKGSILDLPFKAGEIASLSSICVIEHIGLGRYGDPLDSFGSEKAFAELIRVLAPRGDLYISVPVDTENKVYFNAHRAFTRNYILELTGLTLIEERYIYGANMENTYNPKKGFGTGLYHFRKK